jgi:hypothetical protein
LNVNNKKDRMSMSAMLTKEALVLPLCKAPQQLLEPGRLAPVIRDHLDRIGA